MLCIARIYMVHLVFTQIWWMNIFASRSSLVCPCAGVHKRILLMSSALTLQFCWAYLVHITWMICKMGCKWLYSCRSVGCCLQTLFKTKHNILVLFPSSFFSERFFWVHVMQPYSSTDTVTAWEKSLFTLSEK